MVSASVVKAALAAVLATSLLGCDGDCMVSMHHGGVSVTMSVGELSEECCEHAQKLAAIYEKQGILPFASAEFERKDLNAEHEDLAKMRRFYELLHDAQRQDLYNNEQKYAEKGTTKTTEELEAEHAESVALGLSATEREVLSLRAKWDELAKEHQRQGHREEAKLDELREKEEKAAKLREDMREEEWLVLAKFCEKHMPEWEAMAEDESDQSRRASLARSSISSTSSASSLDSKDEWVRQKATEHGIDWNEDATARGPDFKCKLEGDAKDHPFAYRLAVDAFLGGPDRHRCNEILERAHEIQSNDKLRGLAMKLQAKENAKEKATARTAEKEEAGGYDSDDSGPFDASPPASPMHSWTVGVEGAGKRGPQHPQIID